MKVEDERFAHLKKDPRFKKVGKEKKKVKIDNRFKHMFTAPEFASVDFLDQRGRKEKQVTKEKLERFYEISSGESDEDESEVEEIQSTEDLESAEVVKPKKKDVTQPPQKKSSDEGDSEDGDDDDNDNDDEDEMSDSSDGESTDEEEVPAEAAIDAWDAVNTCTETISEATYRISICSLNWDRMNATDIFVLCTSSLHESTGTSTSNILVHSHTIN